jgi:hypothetical protein
MAQVATPTPTPWGTPRPTPWGTPTPTPWTKPAGGVPAAVPAVPPPAGAPAVNPGAQASYKVGVNAAPEDSGIFSAVVFYLAGFMFL